MKKELYLEDFAVGQRFLAGPLILSAEDIIAFGRVCDPQFFHVDPEAAKRSMFGGLIASGWQTAAMSMKCAFDGGAPFPDGVVGAGADIQWVRPVRPDDRLMVETEVLEVSRSRSRPGRGMLRLRTTTMNQAGEAVQTIVSKVVVFARETGVT